MSVQAMSWAFKQPIQHSSAKFVLVVLANCADADMICWPSYAHLIEATAQDRKTIVDNIRRLREWGYLEDTGERKGATKSIVVFRLRRPENGIAEVQASNTEFGIASTPPGSSENGTDSSSENGIAQESEAVPFFPRSSPVFPHKQSRFSLEAVPKTGLGTIKNHQEPSRNQKTPISPFPKSSTKKKRSKPEPENLEAFEKFWAAYPRKEAKPRAIAAFNDLNPDGELLETIIAAIETAKRSDKWQKDGGKYIHGPVNYLKDERWNDVIDIQGKPDKHGWDSNLRRHTRPCL